MSLVNRLLTRVGGLSNSFNPNNLSGAIDVVVVQHPDGSLFGSPFHARFGKSDVLRPRDNEVELHVNEQKVSGLKARLGPSGGVYFPEELGTQLTLTAADTVSPSPGVDDDDSGNFSEPETCSGDSGRCDWRSGQPPPRKSATSASLSAPPTPPSSMAPSPSSSFSSLLLGDDEEELSMEKQIRLTSEQLQSLGLQPGANRLRYAITTKFQGTASCVCAVYLWRYDDRLVVSDIDGTITKSDLFGQVFPIFGKDWTQPTVVRLFSAVERNGYRFLYLSSRGLGQSRTTRHFMEGVCQDGTPLPDGPILLSPTSLIAAFHREVIARRPQDFKIPCLRDVAALFPPPYRPFWAGFGNRLSDAATYKEVGIPAERCFTVNSNGELLRGYGNGVDCRVDNCGSPPIDSYRALADIVDHVFPPPDTSAAADDPCGSYFDCTASPISASATTGATMVPEANAMVAIVEAEAKAETEARRRRSSNLAMWLSEVNLYL